MIKELFQKLLEMEIFDEITTNENQSVQDEDECPECGHIFETVIFDAIDVDEIEKSQSLELRLLLQDIENELKNLE